MSQNLSEQILIKHLQLLLEDMKKNESKQLNYSNNNSSSSSSSSLIEISKKKKTVRFSNEVNRNEMKRTLKRVFNECYDRSKNEKYIQKTIKNSQSLTKVSINEINLQDQKINQKKSLPTNTIITNNSKEDKEACDNKISSVINFPSKRIIEPTLTTLSPCCCHQQNKRVINNFNEVNNKNERVINNEKNKRVKVFHQQCSNIPRPNGDKTIERNN